MNKTKKKKKRKTLSEVKEDQDEVLREEEDQEFNEDLKHNLTNKWKKMKEPIKLNPFVREFL